MVIPAMQLAGKIPDVHVQLWSSALLKGAVFACHLFLHFLYKAHWFLLLLL